MVNQPQGSTNVYREMLKPEAAAELNDQNLKTMVKEFEAALNRMQKQAKKERLAKEAEAAAKERGEDPSQNKDKDGNQGKGKRIMNRYHTRRKSIIVDITLC